MNDLRNRFFRAPVWAPNDGAGAQTTDGATTQTTGGTTAQTTGGTTAQTTGETTAQTTGETTAQTTGGTTAQTTSKWWEDPKAFNEKARTMLTAKGLTVDDPIEALTKLSDMHLAAEQRLGADPKSLISKPKEGQSLSQYLAENREAFGLPADAEGYTVERPESWPKDAPWDEDLEKQARAMAVEHGWDNATLQAAVNLYASKAGGLIEQSETQLKEANSKMMAALEKDWGDQTKGKIAQAQQAAGMLAEQIGLDKDGLANLTQALTAKTGDASTIKMFAAIAEMMGEDSLQGAGRGTMGMTPAEARAELAKLRAPGGAFYTATETRNNAQLAELKPRMEELAKIAAQ